MKKALSLAAVASIVLLAGFARAPAAGAAVQSYTGCLSPILNAIYDVAPGDAPAHACVRPAAVIRLSSGDVTSLAAGTGLTGGGDNGDLSMSIAPSYRLPQSCTNGQGAGWNATGWACAAFASQADFNAFVALLGSPGAINQGSNPVHWTKLKGVPAGFTDGIDDVGLSEISSGPGLTGTGASGDPLQIAPSYRAPQTCSAGQIPKWTGSVWACGSDNEGVGSGAVGHTPAANDVSTLDSVGNVGFSTSITIGADGLGLVSYYDVTNADLKVAHCSNASCTSATESTLDSAGEVGLSTSVTIGADALGLVAYSDYTNGELKVAHCSNAACTSATISTLDNAAGPYSDISIAIGTDGLALVAYDNETNGDLKVAHCSNAACTSATTSTPISGGGIVLFPTLAVGADGLGLISYVDNATGEIKVVHCSNVFCTNATSLTLGNGNGSSVTIGADGLGLVSYGGIGFLKVAHCSNAACTNATTSALDTGGLSAAVTSITVGADGLGLISYVIPFDEHLAVAHCSNATCTGATTSTLDSPGVYPSYDSVTVGADGLGLISYHDGVNGDLKVAHLSNAFGVPYFRRR